MGGEKAQPTMQDGDEAPGSSDDSSSEEEDNALKQSPEDVDSEGDASDDGSDYNDQNGGDILPTTAMDIPTVDDIPIVS